MGRLFLLLSIFTYMVEGKSSTESNEIEPMFHVLAN